MNARLPAIVFFCGLFFSTLSSRAQIAFAQLASATEAEATRTSEKSPTYKMIHGVVQDTRGALPGATIWLRGSRTIAVANAEGEFELQVPANATVVELTYGYGGLEDEIIRLAPVQALGSLYLLRTRNEAAE